MDNLNLSAPGAKTFVLLEDDRFLRKLWEIEARKAGLSLSTHPTTKSLEDQLPTIPNGAIFLLDNTIEGAEGQGRQLARVIRAQRPQATIVMQSGDDRAHFLAELESGVVDQVIGKDPDFVTPLRIEAAKKTKSQLKKALQKDIGGYDDV